MAPIPTSAENTCEECDGVPRTRSTQPELPRRATTTCRGSPSPSSNPIAAVAPPAGAVDPPGLEAESLQLGGKDSPDLAHAVVIRGPTVHVDGALKELERGRCAALDAGDDPPLGAGEPGPACGGTHGKRPAE